jgi:hypothetical protein
MRRTNTSISEREIALSKKKNPMETISFVLTEALAKLDYPQLTVRISPNPSTRTYEVEIEDSEIYD